MNDSITVTRKNGVAVLMLNRADAFNAFDLAMGESFARNLVALASERRVRGIVISGAGKAFCAGGDLKWALSWENGAATAFHELAGRFHLAITEIRRMPKPVIAAVNGVAAGGGFSLALACDFRVMAKSAALRQAYTSSGLCIDGGGTFSLPRLVGLGRALEIAAFDRPIPAEQALSWGLASKVVEDGTALEAGIEMAGELAQKSLHAFGMAKQLLTDSFDTSFETQIERERKALSACAEHPEGQEGLKAFAEKRKPKYA
ncbi:MAG TPA: enoyl-CoA hydratase-related protein [Burkholderiales bacterium]|nr:enoyl-CoA hydratase-related protein [Burkholderiales bacterium]